MNVGKIEAMAFYRMKSGEFWITGKLLFFERNVD